MSENKIETNWPDLTGRIVGKQHILPVRVYYEDTDFSGVVYHASYLKFMERGRTEVLRMRGVHHHELDTGLHGERLAFAVRHMDIDFLKPARIDDVLEVHTDITECKGVRLIIQQRVMRGDEVLITAKVTAVAISAEGKPRRLPKGLIAKMNGEEAQ
ncbi:Acyl-CoA thioester hydrolase YbgC [Pseudovibrio axinellae]|uniref:Acyl-CoA thioester hydrolase YbgC n=1 Tax=Pseudovibrio axinellae TaxID=989403 RepID=A0A166ABU2_9HYPH|nr:tol-pal system-associated acyl-CoA thioesterase [Pseudovibrio axinellae]KZL20842.1 Acyl-CoA thioester hydrolase YbgC [Pseudovibrio axinellae]SER20962.1 acyl-CoA thioester hydrolase [Pseudovibrio axinellae]